MRKCSSSNWCHGTVSAAAPETEKFCENCRLKLNRVAATLPKNFNKQIRQRPAVITKQEPPRKLRAEYRRDILKALADGPLGNLALAKAVGAKSNSRTFARARADLIAEGLVTSRAAGDWTRIYSLATTAPPAASAAAPISEAPAPAS
jgi:hypothetical protein